MNNPYWERITAIAERQRSKGLQNYGRGIEENDAAIRDRLDELEEELVDSLMYLEWLRDGLQITPPAFEPKTLINCSRCKMWPACLEARSCCYPADVLLGRAEP